MPSTNERPGSHPPGAQHAVATLTMVNGNPRVPSQREAGGDLGMQLSPAYGPDPILVIEGDPGPAVAATIRQRLRFVDRLVSSPPTSGRTRVGARAGPPGT